MIRNGILTILWASGASSSSLWACGTTSTRPTARVWEICGETPGTPGRYELTLIPAGVSSDGWPFPAWNLRVTYWAWPRDVSFT